LRLFFPLGIDHGQHPAFGHPAVVMKAGDFDTVIPATLHQSGQHTNGIPEQRGVGGMMDVALNTGAIDAHLATLFDFFALA
jgi:hypothetical protein